MSQHNCQQIHELLSAYIENELEPTTALTVARQLEQCAKCRHEFEQMSEVTGLIKRAFSTTGKLDNSVAERAAAINERVRAQLLAGNETSDSFMGTTPASTSMATPTTGDATSNSNVVSMRSKYLWIKRLALAATLLIAFGFIGLFTLIYQADFSGPLLTAVVRNHYLCGVMEDSGVSIFQGVGSATLSARFNVTVPELTKVGLTFDNGHPCRVYRAPFIHMMYLKDKKPVSVYYGSEEAVSKLRETEGSVEPNKIYSAENRSVMVAAFAPKTDKLWIVAGDLSPAEMKQVTTELLDKVNEQSASLR